MGVVTETLMELPVFKGAGIAALFEVVEKMKLGFQRFDPGSVIVSAGDSASSLKCLINGCVRLVTDKDNGIRISQIVTAPDILGPQYLFGIRPLYPFTATAVGDTPCSVVDIDKNEYLKILKLSNVFTYNYLNILATEAQTASYGALAVSTGTLEDRIAFMVVALTQMGSTEITVESPIRSLPAVFGVKTSVFMRTLESMRERGLVEFEDNRITVSSRRALVRLLESHL